MEQLPLPPFSRFFYDAYGFYAYVMMNGDEQAVDDVIRVMQQKGLKCPLKGKSQRRASNGLLYDWYIRVFDSDNKKPKKEVVEPILYRHFGVVPVEQQIEEFENRIKKYQNELQSLQAKIQEETRSQEEILNSAITLEEKVNRLQEQNDELRKQIESYEQVVFEQQEEIEYLKNLRKQMTADSSHKGFSDILQVLFPDMEFVRDTLDYLIEAEDRDWGLRTLVKVYTNSGDLRSKRYESVSVKGRKIWREVDSNGPSRIYYARVGNKVHIYADRKREQRHTQNILNSYSKEKFGGNTS